MQTHFGLALSIFCLFLLQGLCPINGIHSNFNHKKASEPLVGRYIVFTRKGITPSEFAQHKNFVIQKVVASNKIVNNLRFRANVLVSEQQNNLPFFVNHEYEFGDVQGYSGSFDQETIDLISQDKNVVDFIENDRMVHTYQKKSLDVQHGATWGISRISHHKAGKGREKSDYEYPSSAGIHVEAYIIDTGIDVKHSEFEGRARWGATFCEFDPDDKDGNGHGTHVAGTVGGKLYGVAKRVNLTAVKVLSADGSGSLSDVIKGIEWAINNHLERKKNDSRARSVANLSLGGGISVALDKAVNYASSKNLHFAVAAGNSFDDACMESPARASGAISVGATNDKDQLACFSNHGSCVTVLAPGEDITSSWPGSPDGVNTISGTSMASPHVCGGLALIQSEHPDLDFTHKEIVNKLTGMSTSDVIHKMPKKGHGDYPHCPYESFDSETNSVDSNDSEGKTPNKLLYVLEEEHLWSSYQRYIPQNMVNRLGRPKIVEFY